MTKRYTRGWSLLGGYTYSRTRVDLTSLANPNTAFVNAAGESGGRRHNLKASGTYDLPYKIVVGANFRLQSGLPITRTWAIPLRRRCSRTQGQRHRQRRAARQRGAGRAADARRARRALLLDWAATGSSSAWTSTTRPTPTRCSSVRTNTGVSTVRVAGDPNNPATQITSFLSPTAVLAPRVLRFNISYNFGR